MSQTPTQKIRDEHMDEWEKYSELYKNMAKTESINDPFFYRHRCIQGLINDTTYNYN